MWELYQKLLKLPPSTFYYLEENSITPPSQVWNYQQQKNRLKGNEGQRIKLPLERKWTWYWCHVSVFTGYHESCCYLSPISRLWVLSAILKLSINVFFFKQNSHMEPTVLSKQWKQTWRYNVFWLDCQLCLNQAFFFERKSETISFILCTSHYLP